MMVTAILDEVPRFQASDWITHDGGPMPIAPDDLISRNAALEHVTTARRCNTPATGWC